MIDDEVEDLVAISVGEYFKSTKENLYSKLFQKRYIRKVAESLDIFLTTPVELEKSSNMMQSKSSDNFVHRYNIDISTWIK